MVKGALFLSIVTFFFLVQPIFAQNTLDATESAAPYASGSAVKEVSVQYELPYPGLLPDHPLYFLKMTRDKIVGLLINDPLKKAEFNLLNADKRMHAGVLLVKKKEYDLAVTTISKSINYVEEARVAEMKAKQAGKYTPPFESKLETALAKHTELTQMLVQNMDKKYVQQFKNELKRMRELQKRMGKKH